MRFFALKKKVFNHKHTHNEVNKTADTLFLSFLSYTDTEISEIVIFTNCKTIKSTEVTVKHIILQRER